MFKKLKSLFKKKSTVVEQPETKREESQLDFPIDRTDYFFDHALVFYCEENNIPSEKLSKSDMLEISKRRSALVRRHLDERNLARHVDHTNEVGSKHERSVKHGEQQRVLACHVLVDTIGYDLYFLKNLSFGD